MLKNCKKGFTLLELLVVVLIIGILASIALPQYDKAVTKARLAEVLINVKAIEGSIDRYLLKNGFPDDDIGFQDFGDIELSGGEWVSDNGYKTDKNTYDISCYSGGCGFLVTKKDSTYSSALLEFLWFADSSKVRNCYTNDIDKGRFICEYLKSFGWEYIDGEY